jgi:hypothetical protein
MENNKTATTFEIRIAIGRDDDAHLRDEVVSTAILKLVLLSRVRETHVVNESNAETKSN